MLPVLDRNSFTSAGCGGGGCKREQNVSGVVLNTELRGTLAENIAVLRARLRLSLCVRWKGRRGGGDAFHSRMNILSVLVALHGWGGGGGGWSARARVCVCVRACVCACACRAGVCMPLLSFLVCSDLFFRPADALRKNEGDRKGIGGVDALPHLSVRGHETRWGSTC